MLLHSSGTSTSDTQEPLCLELLHPNRLTIVLLEIDQVRRGGNTELTKGELIMRQVQFGKVRGQTLVGDRVGGLNWSSELRRMCKLWWWDCSLDRWLSHRLSHHHSLGRGLGWDRSLCTHEQ